MIDKQIEEMAKILQRVYNCYGEFNAEWFAEHLAVNNIGKIPEGAVVLTQEEWEGYCATQESLGEIMETERRIARKETAEKFAERLKQVGKLHYSFGEQRYDIATDYIDEICKEFTEGKSCEG